MNSVRRGVLAFLGGLILGKPSLGRASSKQPAFTASRSSYTPRHVLCFLGKENGLAALQQSARAAIDLFADDFTVDKEFSQDEPDDRMERSFNVCWDRVDPNAYQEMDEDAVAGHGSVLYVLGPSMTADIAVTTSAKALMFVQYMLDHGAIAAKGESAGVAHGVRRWKELFEQARDAAASHDLLILARTCRLAFARRPIGDDAEGMASVGFHLVGLPDVLVTFARKDNHQPSTNAEQLKIAALIDDIADEMTREGVETALADRKATLADDTRYEEDGYKFNPFGVTSIQEKKL
ncbi:hypothetical protein [Rhizobium rhizogenes]|uniref:Uncharacterized protein n=1 Tax=Rhizobium rhizogenes (strain K84 / ATCC BAA-868) TaxID=311403 RepID=B9JJS6_RHIR8|nr:hypothetical protein [Rhizobium rhizogenes]ACM30168.1 conserved hypothetical protein [Rhizobium rhizogenes K84]OCJ10625.1 hypothetical protein A6U88_20105 [Agrobacterium sp. B131/95]MDJ1633637.1 hypothetical protein [Rhizobium rhizogenes]NTG77090.1 hypothetical protein [Rhizobium rhizogenes]NTI45137.1 hypothetical protein [Rhizobium rhizogenes]